MATRGLRWRIGLAKAIRAFFWTALTSARTPGVVPVGYSMGGRIALHAALGEPGRWPALVLVGVSAGLEDPDSRRAADGELADWIEAHPIEEVVQRWETQPVFATQPPELVAAQRPGRLSHSPADLAQLLRTAGQGAMPAVWDRLPDLELPVLCMAGELDDKLHGRRPPDGLAAPAGHRAHDSERRTCPAARNPEAVVSALREFLDERL